MFFLFLKIWLWGIFFTLNISLCITAIILGRMDARSYGTPPSNSNIVELDFDELWHIAIAYAINALLWPLTVPVVLSYGVGHLSYEFLDKVEKWKVKRREIRRRKRSNEGYVFVEEQ